MIRVLQIGLTDNIGGIETYQKNLLKYIDKEKFSFDFVTCYDKVPVSEEIIENGGTIHKLKAKTVFSYCKKLYCLIKNNNYDIIHINKNSCANPLEVFIASCAKAKVIIAHSHNTKPTIGKVSVLLHYIFRPFVKKKSNVHLACSELAAKWFFGKTNDAIVVKNGIETDLFSFNEKKRNKMRETFSLNEELVIGHVGNFIPQKNHKFLIDILYEVLKKLPNAKLLLVGKGSLMEEIRKYVSLKNIDSSVLFAGSRNDVVDLCMAMDVFVFPSLHEGLPISAIEAQATGLPCIFSDLITKEVLITDKADMLSLDLGAKEWSNIIINRYIQTKKTDRHESSDIITKSGYNIVDSAKIIEKIYIDNLSKNE